MGDFPMSVRCLLHCEKCLHLKKPREAERGDGCGAFRRWCFFWNQPNANYFFLLSNKGISSEVLNESSEHSERILVLLLARTWIIMRHDLAHNGTYRTEELSRFSVFGPFMNGNRTPHHAHLSYLSMQLAENNLCSSENLPCLHKKLSFGRMLPREEIQRPDSSH